MGSAEKSPGYRLFSDVTYKTRRDVSIQDRHWPQKIQNSEQVSKHLENDGKNDPARMLILLVLRKRDEKSM
ncbi:hypothetical protein OESDEN_00557 [Oesophagostomum dentatum]|uniref:Uncharacterized protein n=1 Tax=Oesophagostomum dentatum TaxID=61180 RepID=A0A0B1TPG2_OESDE|nr:hypothetical protein OESDEN_00557 [Oesophagostomum dentatum]